MEYPPQHPGPSQRPAYDRGEHAYGDGPPQRPAPAKASASGSPFLPKLLIGVIVLVICIGGLVGGYTIITTANPEEPEAGGWTASNASTDDPESPGDGEKDEGESKTGGGGEVKGNVERTPRLGMEVFQDDKAAPLTHDVDADDARQTEVALQPGPFELRVPALKKDVALQICAWTDDSIFSLSSDMKLTETKFFAPGTGAADTEFGSGSLFLGTERHNYLIDKRLKKLSDSQDAVYYSSVFQDSGTVKLADWRQPLHLTVFTDENGDGAVGNSEYEYLVLDFGTSD